MGTDLTRRPKATEVTGYNTMMNRGTTTTIQRNKISGYSVLQDSDASSDEKEDEESEDEIQPKMDPVLFVKRSLTEILLEVTNTELRAVVMECLQQQKAIRQLDELCKSKEQNGSNGLDLVSYNDQSSPDSDSSSDSSSSNSKDREKRKAPSPPIVPQIPVTLKPDSNKENNSSKRKHSKLSPVFPSHGENQRVNPQNPRRWSVKTLRNPKETATANRRVKNRNLPKNQPEMRRANLVATAQMTVEKGRSRVDLPLQTMKKNLHVGQSKIIRRRRNPPDVKARKMIKPKREMNANRRKKKRHLKKRRYEN